MKYLYVFLIIALFLTLEVNANVHIGNGQTYANIQSACPFIKPGDTVFVHQGNYNTQQYYNGLKGTSDNWIVITAFNKENIVINCGWQFTSSEYIRIEYLNFKTNSNYNNTLLHFDHAGDCSKLSNNIVVDACTFMDVAGGNTIKFGGASDFIIKNCKFINNTSNAAGIALNESRRGVIQNCYFENIRTKAIQFKLGTFDIVVNANYFKNSGNDDSALKIGESGGKEYYCLDANTFHAKNIKVYSNIFEGGRTPFSIGLAENTEIINNTIIKPNNFVMRILSDEADYFNLNHKIINNIFYLDKSIYFNGTSNATNIDFSSILIQNNLFYSISKPNWKGPDPYGGDYDAEEIKGVKLDKNIILNPLFVDESKFDYKLANNSPALSAGMSVDEPLFDFYGKPYKLQRALGAIESDSVKAIINVLDIFLNLNEVELNIGDSLTLIAMVYPSDADNTNVGWSSTDNNIVKVDNKGIIQANKVGVAKIIAITEDGGFKDTCNVKVVDASGISDHYSKYKIYPNPTTDYINIPEEYSNNEIVIFDILGEIMIIKENSNKIDISHLNKGLYYIKFNNKFAKFIKI